MRTTALAILSLMMASSLYAGLGREPNFVHHFSDNSLSGSSGGAEDVTELSQANFQKFVLNSKKPVLVDFYATWCPPCKLLGPIVDGLAKKYSGKVTFYRVDVDKNRELAGKFNIQAIPTCKFFKRGKLVDDTTGLVTEEELRSKLDKVL
jgi:thioredoxin 1